MAWDRDRPVAPFMRTKEGTIAYNQGERMWMESFSYITPTNEIIEKVWDDPDVPLRRDDWGSIEFRAFKDVELTLRYDGFGRGRSSVTFYWRDEDNVRYPMFAAEVDRLIKNGVISNKIGGVWSADKRGQNYGIRLERVLWRSSSNADE